MSRSEDGLAIISDHLKKAMFDSATVIKIDSIVVPSLFGQRSKKKNKRVHQIKTLSITCFVDQETKDKIFQTFQEKKDELNFEDPKAYLDITNQIAASLYEKCPLLQKHGSDSEAIIEWCISAYALVVNPKSSVKLSCIGMGPEGTLGFAIHARIDIPKGYIIRELAGLIPKDGGGAHSQKTNDQNQSDTKVKRIPFGPIRFMNHICGEPNTQVSCRFQKKSTQIKHEPADYCNNWKSGVLRRRPVALQDITAGEELLVDYGKERFSNEPGGCPCKTCKPDQQFQKRKREEKDEATIEGEKKECRKAKRARQRGKKKEKKAAARRNADEAGPSKSGEN